MFINDPTEKATELNLTWFERDNPNICCIDEEVYPSHLYIDCKQMFGLERGSKREICRVCSYPWHVSHRCEKDGVKARKATLWRTLDGKYKVVQYVYEGDVDEEV